MVKKKVEKSSNYDFAKHAWEQMFKEAKERGEELWPDDAIRQLMELTKKALKMPEIKESAESNKKKQIDMIAIAREIHIHAVKLFYSTYIPRKGAPPLDDDYLARLLEMKRQGITPRQIALQEEPDLKTAEEIDKAEQKIRKRLAKAEKLQRSS
jgi:hypothetical protein